MSYRSMTNIGIQSAAVMRRRSPTVLGRAAIISSPKQVDINEVEVRAPAWGEVRVRLEGCGVCASSIPLWEGRDWFQYPLEPGAPGHEAWGRVDAIGADVTVVNPGDRIAMLSSHAYQDYDIAMADRVIKLPSALDNVVFPGEPLGCAMNIFKRSRIASGETVAIVGIGFLGALLTMLATNAGARVFAISRRASLSTVRQFGAAENIQFTNSKEVLDRVMDLTDGGGCDCVIEAAGKQQSLDLASELTCERGRLVIAGYHQDGKRKIDLQLWNWRGLDVINAHERDPAVYLNGMSEAIEAIESGAIDPAPLYTHRFRLDELPQAFRTLTRCGEGFTKALIIL